jgi:hypothetical protein
VFVTDYKMYQAHACSVRVCNISVTILALNVKFFALMSERLHLCTHVVGSGLAKVAARYATDAHFSPLPLISDLWDKLAGASVLSSLDLQSD